MRHRKGEQKKEIKAIKANSRVFEHGKFRRSKIKVPSAFCDIVRDVNEYEGREGERGASRLTQNVWRKQPTVKHSIQWRLGTLDCGGVGGEQVTRLNIERVAYFARGLFGQSFVRPSHKKTISQMKSCPRR